MTLPDCVYKPPDCVTRAVDVQQRRLLADVEPPVFVTVPPWMSNRAKVAPIPTCC